MYGGICKGMVCRDVVIKWICCIIGHQESVLDWVGNGAGSTRCPSQPLFLYATMYSLIYCSVLFLSVAMSPVIVKSRSHQATELKGTYPPPPPFHVPAFQP